MRVSILTTAINGIQSRRIEPLFLELLGTLS